MTHDEMRLQLDAYLDGELASGEARALEAHLDGCSDCARVRESRTALSRAIRRELQEFRAPDELRSRVRQSLRSAAEPRRSRSAPVRPGWQWLAVAASLALVAVGGWELGARRSADAALTDQILASHVRSLMPGHLTDVVSSDQHTVKPWFNGKLDFSPPVSDFAGRGYPLLGGRLDYLDGRPVAALVYQRRRHLINVYLWPTSKHSVGERAPITRQGYHLLHWSAPDYAYWVVSDLGVAELADFARLLQEADAASSAGRVGPDRY